MIPLYKFTTTFPINLTDIATAIGVKIVYETLPTEICGVLDPTDKSVKVNNSLHDFRQKYTLAFALAVFHLYNVNSIVTLTVDYFKLTHRGYGHVNTYVVNHILVPDSMWELAVFKKNIPYSHLADTFGVTENIINFKIKSMK